MKPTDKAMMLSAKCFAGASSLLLRTGRRRPGVRIKVCWRRDFTAKQLRPLHELACKLMAEEFEHFRIHADTNDVVHEFRRADTGELVGFQFWRTAPLSLPHCRAIVGGKLRILPEFRGRALHLLSGLLFYLHAQTNHPRTRYYRLSIASPFGFVSITEALHRYQILDPGDDSPEGRAIMTAFSHLAAQSHYDINPNSGLIFVDIRMTPETLANFGRSYFDRPAAQIYAKHNPEYRTNGCYIAFWFRFTPANLWALTHASTRKLWRDTAHRDRRARSEIA